MPGMQEPEFKAGDHSGFVHGQPPGKNLHWIFRMRSERRTWMLRRMSTPVLVQIIASPIACKEGIRDSWREVAAWTEQQLHLRFGEAVQVRYHDLFDADCPPIPQGAQLPVVLIAAELFSNGGKISLPAIRKRIETILKADSVI
jgi:hypothetical protein